MKVYPLEKFNIFSNFGGLDDVNDMKKIQALEFALSKKPIQFRIVSDDLLVYLSGVLLFTIQARINNYSNVKIVKSIQKFIKLQFKFNKLFLVYNNEPLIRLRVYGDSKIKKFYVALDEV